MKRREIKDKINKMTIQSKRLTELSKDDKLSYSKIKKINKEQDNIYKKCEFFKEIYKRLGK